MDTNSSHTSIIQATPQAQLVQLKISTTLPNPIRHISPSSTLSSSSSNPSVQNNYFSAGSIQPSRVRLLSPSSFLRASQNQLALVHVPKVSSIYSHWNTYVDEQNNYQHQISKRSKRVGTTTASTSSVTSPYLLEEGGEDASKQSIQSTHYSYPIDILQTKHEIMSIDIQHSTATTSIGTIDNHGYGKISMYDSQKFQYSLTHHQALDAPLSSYTIQIPHNPENSWTGLSISPVAPSSIVACTHTLQKEIYIFDSQRTIGSSTSSSSSSKPLNTKYQNTTNIISQYSTLLNPTNIQYFPLTHHNAHCLAITEGNSLRIIDPRIPTTNKHQSTIFRDTPGNLTDNELLYSLSIGDSQNLAVAGTNSIVYIYDMKMNKLRHRWNCPTKHHIISTQLHENKGLCYIAGADQEVLAWKYMASNNNNHNHQSIISTNSLSSNTEQNNVSIISKGMSGGGGEGRNINYGGFTGKIDNPTSNNITNNDVSSVVDTTTTLSSNNNNKTWIHRQQFIEHKDNNSNTTTASNHDTPKVKAPKLARAGYRGSSRWIGFSVLNNQAIISSEKITTDHNDKDKNYSGDLLLSVCDDGHIYFLNHAERMAL